MLGQGKYAHRMIVVIPVAFCLCSDVLKSTEMGVIQCGETIREKNSRIVPPKRIGRYTHRSNPYTTTKSILADLEQRSTMMRSIITNTDLVISN